MTNLERIQKKPIEEYAEFWIKRIPCGLCPCNNKCKLGDNCVDTFKAWLESEVEE